MTSFRKIFMPDFLNQRDYIIRAGLLIACLAAYLVLRAFFASQESADILALLSASIQLALIFAIVARARDAGSQRLMTIVIYSLLGLIAARVTLFYFYTHDPARKNLFLNAGIASDLVALTGIVSLAFARTNLARFIDGMSAQIEKCQNKPSALAFFHLWRARAYLQDARLPEAIADFKKAVAYRPQWRKAQAGLDAAVRAAQEFAN